jgi:hypothetical protein
MVATSKFSGLFLVLVAVSTNVMALDFNYRFCELWEPPGLIRMIILFRTDDNGGCDHNSAAGDTYPLNSLPPYVCIQSHYVRSRH